MNKPAEKKFLKQPDYPGGKKELLKFIEENLKYPDEALKHGIEGSVLLEFLVNDFGNVFESRVIKGIGFGCDEEALRLVNILKFKKVRNRGLRLTVTRKIKINFRIKKEPFQMVYHYQEKSKDNDLKKGNATYGYTIEF